ncbi:unnamed protein product [Rotaria magnacalcarata]|uniref:Uncharacterized protein n=1 Tax=Rotaria magnacalcarata TaxID=392030 RepID=A0A815WXP1_9BILA|nr:unnamed protein product [Rotaria magnacalcarata]CAF1547553.1 unnamed protein product [Rotaria magnacalcarata]CAF3897859.1 unnamed protein product [Rotaria magnacalcarata]CAF3908644.1 unnamed protein product [Rotaria magnacalcarata]
MCDSQHTRGFSYVNEESIDADVKCAICTDPYLDPVVVLTCNHIFCRTGIERVMKDKPVCPMCRHMPFTLSELQPANLPLVNCLNELLVKCDTCDQMNIKRNMFDEHINKLCPKAKVTCSAADLNCEWTDSRDQLDDHLAHCKFEPLRSVLGPLLLMAKQVDRIQNDNQELQLQVNGLQHRCKQLEMRMHGSCTIPLRTASDININAKWTANGLTVAGYNSSGDGLNQFSNPQGLYLQDEHTLYVADFSNHRIMEWKLGEPNGKIVAGGNGAGCRDNQLDYPTDVIVDKENDCLIICDRGNRRVVRWSLRDSTHGETIISDINCNCLTMGENKYLYVTDVTNNEVRRWRAGETEKTVVAGGNGTGNRLDQLDYPTFIFVDRDHSVYVSDYNNHRVMKWTENAREGIIVAGGRGRGDSFRNSYYPGGVIVDQWGNVYVADSEVHRVICWKKGAVEGKVIAGGNGRGAQPNQFNRPAGILFDKHGNLFVSDFENHRVQKFEISTRDP